VESVLENFAIELHYFFGFDKTHTSIVSSPDYNFVANLVEHTTCLKIENFAFLAG
jgi:hypothetical protein